LISTLHVSHYPQSPRCLKPTTIGPRYQRGLEATVIEIVRGVTRCPKFKGICITHVESFGLEPNWFAQPLTQKSVLSIIRHSSLLGKVRRQFDLLVSPPAAPEYPLEVHGPVALLIGPVGPVNTAVQDAMVTAIAVLGLPSNL